MVAVVGPTFQSWSPVAVNPVVGRGAAVVAAAAAGTWTVLAPHCEVCVCVCVCVCVWAVMGDTHICTQN